MDKKSIDLSCKIKHMITNDTLDLELLEKCKESDDIGVRLDTCEALALFPCCESEKILVQLLDDPEPFVRCSACDSLYFSNSYDTLKKLMCISKNDKYIVRGYAFLSIGDILSNMPFPKCIDFLRERFDKERNCWVKQSIAKALCQNGEVKYFKYILNSLNNNNYRIRAGAVNILIELYEKDKIPDKNSLLEALKNSYNTEQVIFIKENLIKFLSDIENRSN